MSSLDACELDNAERVTLGEGKDNENWSGHVEFQPRETQQEAGTMRRAQEEAPHEATYLEVIIKTIFDDISPKERIHSKEEFILSLLGFKTLLATCDLKIKSTCLNLILKTFPSLVRPVLFSHLFNPPAFTERLDVP